MRATTGARRASLTRRRAGRRDPPPAEAGHAHRHDQHQPEAIPAARDRRRGYQRALAEAGLPSSPELIIAGEGIHRSGDEGARALLALEEPVTAIFCGNDRTALGAYQALDELGLRIPEDISIVGFDDQDVLRDFFLPPLTTVQLPFLAMGEQAAALVLDPAAAAETHIIPCPVIHRGSVAPPKGR